MGFDELNVNVNFCIYDVEDEKMVEVNLDEVPDEQAEEEQKAAEEAKKAEETELVSASIHYHKCCQYIAIYVVKIGVINVVNTLP